MDFIVAASNLKASLYGLPCCRDVSVFIDAVKQVPVPEFKPKSGVTIDVNDSELEARGPGVLG